MSDAELQKLREAEAAVVKARIKLATAESAERFALTAYRESLRNLRHDSVNAHALGELVADSARNHGGECGRLGHAATTPSWLEFRRLLTLLVRRAEEAENAAATRQKADEILERILAPIRSYKGSLPMDVDTLLASYDEEE